MAVIDLPSSRRPPAFAALLARHAWRRSHDALEQLGDRLRRDVRLAPRTDGARVPADVPRLTLPMARR